MVGMYVFPFNALEENLLWFSTAKKEYFFDAFSNPLVIADLENQ